MLVRISKMVNETISSINVSPCSLLRRIRVPLIYFTVTVRCGEVARSWTLAATDVTEFEAPDCVFTCAGANMTLALPAGVAGAPSGLAPAVGGAVAGGAVAGGTGGAVAGGAPADGGAFTPGS